MENTCEKSEEKNTKTSDNGSAREKLSMSLNIIKDVSVNGLG